MTQEEKAKAYDEALERAKAYHRNELAGSKKEMMEYIFPELAESEDERIRRTLVEYFGPKVQLDFVRGVPIQKIRDWLDKQKEQKQTDLPAGKGVAEGKRLMMEEAVEGTVTCHNLNRYILVSGLDESLTYGDKVRVIVLPKED